MKIDEPTIYYIVYWSGHINDTRLRLDTFKGDCRIDPLTFHSVMVPNKAWNKVFCCRNDNNFTVSESRGAPSMILITTLSLSISQIYHHLSRSLNSATNQSMKGTANGDTFRISHATKMIQKRCCFNWNSTRMIACCWERLVKVLSFGISTRITVSVMELFICPYHMVCETLPRKWWHRIPLWSVRNWIMRWREWGNAQNHSVI